MYFAARAAGAVSPISQKLSFIIAEHNMVFGYQLLPFLNAISEAAGLLCITFKHGLHTGGLWRFEKH
jgi:hypothetical protein